MRVACIGNMNNNFFALTRYLRDRGIEADLLIFDNEAQRLHFHPSADTFSLDYQSYTRTLSWGDPFGFGRQSAASLKADLEPYDFLIGCGSAPAFAERAGRALDVFVPYGSDLYVYPFFKWVNPRYQLAYSKFNIAQRCGICRTRCVNLDLSSPDFLYFLNKVGFKGKWLNTGFPMIYTPLYNPTAIRGFYDRSHWYKEIEKLRSDRDLLVFHHARHYWKSTADEISRKSNDTLIKGFAHFVKQNPHCRACLITCEYGPDVLESKKLIKELEIEPNVFWLPQMARKDLLVCLSLCDLGSAEFYRSWFSCGTVYETLSMGKPLLHYRDDSLYKERYRDQYPELYPLLNVKTSEQITAALAAYWQNPADSKQLGERGREWFQRYVIDYVVDIYVDMIRQGIDANAYTTDFSFEPAVGNATS